MLPSFGTYRLFRLYGTLSQKMTTYMEDVDTNWCFEKSDKLWEQISDSYYGVISEMLGYNRMRW
jgi:hypothetical protein